MNLYRLIQGGGLKAPLVAALLLAGAAIAPAAAQPAPSPAAPAGPGLKHTIAVESFGGGELTQGAATAESLAALLTDALSNDGRFIVVERAALGNIQMEQQLGKEGAATQGAVAKTGQLIGAGLYVRGSVTKFSAAAAGNGLSFGGPSIGGFGRGGGGGTSKATMTISLRVIDTTTGQVLATYSGDGSASSHNTNIGITNNRTGATVGTSNFAATPVGKAAQEAIGVAVGKLAANLGNVPWSALVVDDRSGVVYLNAGADQNVQPGLTLTDYRKGEVMTDPGSGEVLDVQMTKVAVVQIDAVREKISTAHIVSGDPPARGDMLKAQ